MDKFISKLKSSKTEEELFVYYGINDGIIDQLIENAKNDLEVKKYTNDEIRFKNRESFENWFKKGSEIYTLTDSENNLFGVIWFRYRKIPEDSTVEDKSLLEKILPVFSIRIYEKARGKGFAVGFMKTAFEHFLNKVDTKSDKIWLGVYKSNTIAHNLYRKFGFLDAGEIPSWHEYLMVYKKFIY